MIVFISGILAEKEANQVIIDVHGIGYLCKITTNTYDILPGIGEKITLLTYFHVTENSQELYGFLSENERTIFILLISISGIGPKTAIPLLSAISPEEFKRRIIASEVSMLTALPGIGPKTARRIIIELKDKFVKMTDDELPFEDSKVILPKVNEAHDALLALGFKSFQIRNVLKQITKDEKEISTEHLIKKALGLLR